MGMFDDLVPGKVKFDDLIPAQTEDPGTAKALAIGAGRQMDRMAAGLRNYTPAFIRDPLDALGRKLGMADGSQIEAQQKANDEAYKPLADKYPVATGLGEAIPAAMMTATAAGPAAMIAGSALPGLLEYGTAQERLMRGGMGALGGAAGAAICECISTALQPSKYVATRAPSDALEAAQRLGYKTTAGQETGSKLLQVLEQQAAKNPAGSGTAQAFNQANMTALNRAAARAMGESGDELTEEMFAGAAKRLGGHFENAFAGKEIPVSSGFKAHAQLLTKQASRAGEFADPQVMSLAERAAAVAERGSISGEEYQAMRSALTAMKRQAAAGNNGPMKSAAASTIRALDDAAEKVIPAEEIAAFAKARGQYAAMKTLEKRGAVKAGNVDPAIIRNALQSGDRSAFARGNIPGDLADIARIGNAFRPLPDSGTAGNAMAHAMLTGGAGLLGPGALITSLVAPNVATKALFSDAGRKYLSHGLLKVSPELERALIAAGAVPGGLLGQQAAR